MLGTFLKGHPLSKTDGKFAANLIFSLQNHTPLTLFQKTFIFVTAFFPLPLTWKLDVFSFLYIFSSNIFLVYALLVSLAVVIVGIYLILHALRLRLSRREPFVFLELTIPASTAKSAYATEQFFTLLHSLAGQHKFSDSLIGHKKRYSLELIATREEGIRYIIGVSKRDAPVIEKGLLSYLPGISIKSAEYSFIKKNKKVKEKLQSLELKLSSDWVIPLSTQKELSEHDPIAYLTGNMTKLGLGEKIIFQVVISPVTRSSNQQALKHLNKVRRLITYDLPLSKELFKTPLQRILTVPTVIVLGVVGIIEYLFRFLADFILSFFNHGSGSTATITIPKELSSNFGQTLNSYEIELQSQVKQKMDHALFEISARLILYVEKKQTARERIAGFLALVAPFASPYQALLKKSFLFDFTSLRSRFIERRLSSFQNPILTASELTDLYHFPFADTTKTEGLITSRSRDLPVPLSQKRNKETLDVVIGTNIYGGEQTSVGLTSKQRQQHTYIVGKTGMGKSTIITGMALQDMENDKGIAVIDPHGDVVKHLLSVIPEHRKHDVVYVNPADKEFPVGLNILNPGTEFSDPEEEHEWITSCLMSIFMKITPENKWGQRMEHILRNACLTSLAAPTSPSTPYVSLYTLQKLLTDSNYRKQIVSTLKDPILKQFWVKEFALFGSMQQADAISPLTNKLGEFLTSPLSRRILLQEKSSLNLSEIMDSGKILLVNLSKGELGEERSAFFGTVIVSLIQLATYGRAQIEEEDRRDFFVYIDEFQNFATNHFTDLFSEARKFHVFFIPTHQNVAQLEDSKTRSIISGNAGTIISLKASPDDEAALLPFLRPEVERGDIVNLSPHHFFMKVTGSESEAGFSGVTILSTKQGSQEVAHEITSYSREHYATPKEVVEERLTLLYGENQKEDKPQFPFKREAKKVDKKMKVSVKVGT